MKAATIMLFRTVKAVHRKSMSTGGGGLLSPLLWSIVVDVTGSIPIFYQIQTYADDITI